MSGWNPLATCIQQIMPLSLATGLFKSVMNIQAPSGNYGASGAPDGAFVPVTGLQGIRCVDAPQSVDTFRITSTEARATAEITSLDERHMLLDHYYPQLSPATNWGSVGWRAVVDGVAYDLMSAEHDSQFSQTRVRCQRVTV